MYKKNISSISLLCSVLFASPSYSGGGDNCNPVFISEELVRLGLSPAIRTNGELISDVKNQLGSVFSEFLIKKNTFLKEVPLNKIDLKTLKWVDEVGLSNKYSPGMQYVFSPFYNQADQIKSAEFMASRIIPFLSPKILARPILMNRKHFNSVKFAFYDNGTYKTAVKFLIWHLKISEKKAKTIGEELYDKMFNEHDFYINQYQLNEMSGHTVNILGHCSPGSNTISDGTNELNYIEVVDILKESGIPSDVNLNLTHCNAGNGNKDQNTGLTRDALIDLFIKRKMKSIIGPAENSYAYLFSKDLFENWPEFSGTISAPYASSSLYYTSSGIMRNPENPGHAKTHKLYAVIFKDLNGTDVGFDRSELQVIYKKENFPKDNNDSQGE